MSFAEFFVVMRRRRDSEVYPDLHKTDGHIYPTEVDAQRALLLAPMPEACHVVAMVAVTREYFDKEIAS